VNDSELQKLIDSYLAGSAGEQDVQHLDALVRADPQVRRQLLAAASLESHLRQLLAHSVPNVRLRQVRPIWRSAKLALGAAVLLLVLTGWGMAGWYARRCHQVEAILTDTNRQLADLQSAQGMTTPPANAALALAPRIVDTRGWVMLLPVDEDFKQGVTIGAGTVIPADRKLWTCPWGGAGTRFPDGTLVSLDRSTVATFTETENTRQIDLKSGIVSVTHRPPLPAGGRMVLKTADGTVTFDHAEVSMAVVARQTIVEVATGTAEFTRAADGKTIKLTGGQYAIIGSGKEFAAVSGVLRWRIEPQNEAGS
jgi:hypothetical protein